MESIKLLRTIQPEQQPSLAQWLTEFKVGSRTPKYSDRAKDMMKLWEDTQRQINFNHTIEKIKI